MKKLICLLIVVLILCGCSNEKSESTVCKLNVYGVDVVNTIEYENDKVIRQTIVNTVNLNTIGIDKETLQQSLDLTKQAYNIKGVTYTAEIKDNGDVKEIIEIDFTNTDFKQLSSAGLIAAEEGQEITHIGYETTLKSLKDYGYTCE